MDGFELKLEKGISFFKKKDALYLIYDQCIVENLK